MLGCRNSVVRDLFVTDLVARSLVVKGSVVKESLVETWTCSFATIQISLHVIFQPARSPGLGGAGGGFRRLEGRQPLRSPSCS